MTNNEDSVNPVKRKKSLKNILSKKDNVNTEQLENLITENKKLQEDKLLIEQMNKELKQQLIEKEQEVFVDQANNVVLTTKNYNDLVNNTIERLGKDDICSYVRNKYKMKVISNAEYNVLSKPVDESYLKNEASHLGYKLLERQDYDYMKSKMETPDEQTIRKTVDKLGLSILSTKEVEHLKNPTKAEMEKKLKALGFSVINENANIRHSNSDISQHSNNAITPPHSKNNSISNANLNSDSNRNSGFYNLKNSSRNSLNSSRVLASRDFFEQVIKEENSSNDVVLEAGRSLGFVRLSQEQYKKLLDGQRDKILTKTDIYSGAKDFQLTVLPNEEYKQLLKNRKKRQSMSFEDLNEYAKKFKLKLSSISKDETVPISDTDSSTSSKRASRIFSPVNDDNSNVDVDSKTLSRQTSNVLTFDIIKDWCKSNNYKLTSGQDFDQKVEEYCKESHQKLVTEEEYQQIKTPGVISLEQVKEYVHKNDLKLLPQNHYDALKAKKDGKFLADYETPEIIEHLKSKNANIHITDKETILNLNKQVKQLEEKEVSSEEAKLVLLKTHHVLTDEELENLKLENKNAFTFEDINNKFPDYTVIHNDDYDDLNTKLDKAILMSQKKKSLEDIHEVVEKEFPEYELIKKNEIKDLIENTKKLEQNQNKKPKTLDEIEVELNEISPDHMVVNREEMFKALEDNTMSYEDLVTVVNEQYPDLVLAKKDFLQTYEKDMKELEEEITQTHQKEIGNVKANYEDVIDHLKADILALNSLENLQEIVKSKFPEMALIEKDALNNANNNNIKTVDNIEHLLSEKFPHMTLVEKDDYKANLEELAKSIQNNEFLVEDLETCKEKIKYLEEQVNDLDKLTNYVNTNYPGNSIVSDELYSTITEDLSTVMKDHEGALNDLKEATSQHEALVEQLNDLSALKEIVNNKHPGHDIISTTEDALKDHVSYFHPTLSVIESDKLKSIREAGNNPVEALDVEKIKVEDVNVLERIIEEKHPSKMLISKQEHEDLVEAVSSKAEKSKESNSEPIIQSHGITEDDLKNPEFVKLSANKIGLDVISQADMTDMSNHFAEIGKQQIQLNELEKIARIKFNAHVLSVEALENLKKNPEINLNLLTETAEEFGLILMSNEEAENLKNASFAQTTVNHELSLEEIGDVATKNGLAVIPVDKFDDYQNLNLNREARRNNMVLLSIEDYTNLTTNQSVVNDSNYNNTHANLNDLLEEPDYQKEDYDMEHKNDDFEFNNSEAVPDVHMNEKSIERTKAFLNNIEDDTSSLSKVETQESKVVLTKNVYKELLDRPEMTKELLVQKARDYDMIAIDLEHFAEITKANMKQNVSVQDAMILLQDRGYISLPSQDYENIMNPSKDEVATLAYNKWNMVLVERSNSLATRNLQDKSRIISGNGSRHASLIQIQPSVSNSGNNTFNNDTSFNNGMYESDQNKENGPYLFQPFQHQRKRSLMVHQQEEVNLVDEAKKQNMLLIPQNMYLRDLHQIPPLNASGKDNGLLLVERNQLEDLIMNEKTKQVEAPANNSAMTHETEVNTIESRGKFQNDKIIISLTQTVIGEYLYKYYNRFGNMGNKPRHERYFWIHPYTMTLYWSLKNPSKDGQHVSSDSGSNHKTKGVGIVGVEVVDDPNPYPPGLYNKSIVILTSDGKNVKITCPTQQRHKVWLRSLKYLQNAANSKGDDGAGSILTDSRSVHGFETRGNKRLSFSGMRQPSNAYEGRGNNRMTPETEQHPKFFVNSLK
ncbi:hypothetical protein FOG51_03365 [Hanseniaspora uvarum]|nr:hypothetical protein FOG51_03365 [Hanseniaspora uvarum]